MHSCKGLLALSLIQTEAVQRVLFDTATNANRSVKGGEGNNGGKGGGRRVASEKQPQQRTTKARGKQKEGGRGG